MYGYDANGFYSEPEVKNAPLLVKRVEDVLFYSAKHKLQMWVGQTLIAESDVTSTPVLDVDVTSWTIDMICMHRVQLAWLGVDVKEEFKKLGGNIDDLYV